MHIPVLNSPEKAFEYILSTIIHTEPEIRLAKVKPVLITFISHPIIKELIGQSEVPAQAKTDNSPNLDLQKIQDSLQQLSKAVKALKKAPPPPHSNNDTNVNKSKQKSPTPHKPPIQSFLAIAGTRPPNPSLLVDLANLGISVEDQVKLEVLCQALNKDLTAITPPQVQLVAVR